MAIHQGSAFPWPHLTADLPGVGGAIKRFDEDFVVSELPLYHPSGNGTHAYLTIEKRGLTTMVAIRMIAQALGKRPADIGYAGLKDAHGITRQMLSVEHVDPERLRSLEFDRIRIVSVDRHTNKLKLGHLSGNRFDIRIRDTIANPLPAVERIVEVLTRRGMPNYFGPQRFGFRGDNAEVGKAVVLGRFDEAFSHMLGHPSTLERADAREARELFDAGKYEESLGAWPHKLKGQARIARVHIDARGDCAKAWRCVDQTMRKLYLSAFQSALFNDVLAGRIAGIDRLETGDVAWKHHNGACFLVEDADTEQPRCEAFEISPSGPLFGRKMKEAQAAPGRMESQVLAAAGISRHHLNLEGRDKLDGARRPLRIPLEDVDLNEGRDQEGQFVRLAFTLGPGSYATCLTREICKPAAI